MRTKTEVINDFPLALEEMIADEAVQPIRSSAMSVSLGEMEVDGRPAQIQVTIQFDEEEWMV